MSLLDRYVEAVRKHLPRAQRDDIAAELREILQTQIEEEEALKERPLTEEEIGGILKRYGPPREVAGRYGAHQYLIGPAVYPSYVFSVKLVLVVLVPLAVFMVLMNVLTAEEHLASRLLSTLWTALVIALCNLALMTLMFARFSRTRSTDHDDPDWDPNDLWKLEGLLSSSNSHEPVRRGDAFGSLLGLVCLLAWWLGLNAAIWRWFGWTPLPFEWTDVWAGVSYAVVPLIVASMGREVMGLLQPRRARLFLGIGILLDLLALPVLLRLLRAGTYVVPANRVGTWEMLVRLFDKGIFVVLLIITMGLLIGVAWGVWRFLRRSDSWKRATA